MGYGELMETLDSKQSYEEYFIRMDFTDVITDSDTIASATVTATDPSPGEGGESDVTNTITDPAKQDIDGTVVNIWVRAGTSGKTYTITCKIVTVAGEKFECEAGLPVSDT